MDRRTLLFSMPVAVVLSTVVSAETDALAASFNNLSRAARLSAQERLLAGGFYAGGLDGEFGPSTRSALINAASFIKDNSYGKVVFNLTKPQGAGRFLSALAAGDLDKYLWGEGDEADGG